MTLNILSKFLENMVLHLKSDPRPPKYLATPTFFSNPGYQSSDVSIAHESRYQGNLARSRLSRTLYRPDLSIQQKLDQTNQKLNAKGHPPLNYEKTMRMMESITNNPNLDSKQKKNQIKELRKQMGLSKKEMKSLFTKPLAKAYQGAADDLKRFLKTKESQLNQELNLAEKIHGKNSPQAQAIQRRFKLLKTSLQPEIDRLSEKSNFYSSMYPSFWNKFKGFFKKVGKGILKGVSVAKKLLGKIPNLLKTFKSFLPAIPGIGPVLGLAVDGMEAMTKLIKR